MPSFPFTITVTSTPSIEVFGVNITYEEILNSFGAYFYLIQKLFIETTSYDQVNEAISFEKYDVNGNKKMDVVVPAVDPFGKQAALLSDLEQYHLIMDGRLTMAFDILPSLKVRFTFFTIRDYLSRYLNYYGMSNKEQVFTL